ncbi:TPA_asm: RNA-directed RNA polymerase, partial [ssRNA phage Esthiorhiza.2_36]
MSKPLPRYVERAVLKLLEDLATPTSLKVKTLIMWGEWDQLSSLKVVPEHYLDAEDYWRDAMAVSLLRKLEELPTSVDRKAVAEESFLACEEECFRANRRLYPYLCPGLPDTDEGVHAYFVRARKILSKILGSPPAYVEGRFGPGSTFGDRGQFCTVPDKMSSEPTLTPAAWPFHFQWLGTQWSKAVASAGKGPTYVQGNRFTTVPKDSTKHRGIAVEPSINVFFQLGYGRVLRKRLGDAGINLRDGQDIHRRLACEASIRGHLATLDLSNASDTVSRNLVKLLLPPRWFDILSDLRSTKTLFRGHWHLLEKFSSMGNGFTFELETLIFLGLILACDPTGVDLVPGKTVFVFGDDIIIPTSYSKVVISALEFSGLTVNEAKSFSSGPFRESCGGDYFLGVDVRPHFLKELPFEPQHFISFANGIRRSAKGDPDRSRRTHRAWLSILDALPNAIRTLRGPEDLGDLCVHDVEKHWRFRWRSQIRYIRVYRPARFRKVSWSNFRSDVVLASAVY